MRLRKTQDFKIRLISAVYLRKFTEYRQEKSEQDSNVGFVHQDVRILLI